MTVNKDWICSCGTVNTGYYCSNCALAKPLLKESKDWICSCGTVNTGNFCSNCGKKKGEQQANLFKNANVGGYIQMGSYPQTATCAIKPIEWQVLSRESNKMLVISKYGLESRRFDEDSNNWRNSEICQWLNNEFYNKVFNKNEKKNIKKPLWGGDKVFLLTKEDVKKYFLNDNTRRCKATEYTLKNGAHVNIYDGYSWWWLRSYKVNTNNRVYCIDHNGVIFYYRTNATDILVRPAMWINI